MNKGFRSWSRPRHKVYVSEPTAIDTTNGNRFRHGFGRVPGNVQIGLLCMTANNGFQPGHVMPLHALFRTAGTNTDGRPYWFEQHTPEAIVVFISATNTEFQTSAFGNVAFNPAQWRLLVRCEDIERPT